ncbi:MAG: hypothetical protein EBY25_07820, partial [Betaproteobacteria bacterium]|nr:hypothetical protein [Betaproteobacteria bacterium]
MRPARGFFEQRHGQRSDHQRRDEKHGVGLGNREVADTQGKAAQHTHIERTTQQVHVPTHLHQGAQRNLPGDVGAHQRKSRQAAQCGNL